MSAGKDHCHGTEGVPGTDQEHYSHCARLPPRRRRGAHSADLFLAAGRTCMKSVSLRQVGIHLAFLVTFFLRSLLRSCNSCSCKTSSALHYYKVCLFNLVQMYGTEVKAGKRYIYISGARHCYYLAFEIKELIE